MAFPFEVIDKFRDIRTHEYKWEVEYSNSGWIIGIIIAICLTLGVAILFWLFLRKCRFFKRFSFGKIGNGKNLHEEVISESGNNGGVNSG
jgi:ribose/xylose/arabinose/galactoside ABC-type transport system permease subunit